MARPDTGVIRQRRPTGQGIEAFAVVNQREFAIRFIGGKGGDATVAGDNEKLFTMAPRALVRDLQALILPDVTSGRNIVLTAENVVLTHHGVFLR